jgi:hypothetical protein
VYSQSPFAGREGYTVRIRRMGSVAVGFSDPDIDSALRVVAADPTRIRTLWQMASLALGSLGARGPAHLAIRLVDAERGSVDFDRWTTIEPEEETLDSVVRDAKRVRGEFAWEPEES